MISVECGVTEAAVRKWMKHLDISGNRPGHNCPPRSASTIERLRVRADRRPNARLRLETDRTTKDRVGHIIGLIGKKANVVVQLEDPRTHQRVKYASAHDVRRGLAQRLINLGVFAETLKVVMRHRDFATTEKHYGAVRSAQHIGAEIVARLRPAAGNSALVGGLKKAPQLSAEELDVLKSFLARL